MLRFLTMAAKLNGFRGQAIFEFIIFIPVMIVLYSIMIWVASAINGSINQQKATRGYAYGIIKGNPMIPIRAVLEKNFQEGEVEIQGMMAFLYADRLTQEEPRRPYAQCYRIPTYGEGDPENCDDGVGPEDSNSPFIRVMTGYGLCGETYENSGGGGLVRIERNYDLSAREEGCLAVGR